MKTEDLQLLWKEEINVSDISYEEMADSIHETLHLVTSRLQRKLWIDISMAFGIAATLILIAFVANLKYWGIVSICITSFTCCLAILYITHQREINSIILSNKPIDQLFTDFARLLRKRNWVYRLVLPLFSGILFSLFSIRFSLTSLYHLLWIIPVSSLMVEIIIQAMYGKTLIELNNLQMRLSGRNEKS